MNGLHRIALLFALVAFVGCGGSGDNAQISTYPVKGKILLANGQPAKGANIILVGSGPTGGPNGIGVLGKDGTFAIKSMGDRDGMAPGKYKVVINPSGKVNGVSADDQKFGMNNIPRKYWDDSTTDMVAEIKAEDNSFEWKLK